MTPTPHEKAEWARLAADAYRAGCTEYGHRYSAAACLPHDGAMPVERYDRLMAIYRRWLIGGLRAVYNC